MKTPTVKRNARAPEVQRAARELGSLALARVRQGGSLKIRQRVQLRRAIATAGEFLAWAPMAAQGKDAMGKASKDVADLTKRAAKWMADELAEELAAKKAELARLERTADSMRELAERDEEAYPAEISYTHTSRHASEGLVTKTETVVLHSPEEAEEAAHRIETKLDSWGKLREQMVGELKQKQVQLQEMKHSLSDFVESTEGLLDDVIATL